MIRRIGRPSRTKDLMGVAMLGSTALLYALSTSGSAPCGSCEMASQAPAAEMRVEGDALERARPPHAHGEGSPRRRPADPGEGRPHRSVAVAPAEAEGGTAAPTVLESH